MPRVQLDDYESVMDQNATVEPDGIHVASKPFSYTAGNFFDFSKPKAVIGSEETRIERTTVRKVETLEYKQTDHINRTESRESIDPLEPRVTVKYRQIPYSQLNESVENIAEDDSTDILYESRSSDLNKTDRSIDSLNRISTSSEEDEEMITAEYLGARKLSSDSDSSYYTALNNQSNESSHQPSNASDVEQQFMNIHTDIDADNIFDFTLQKPSPHEYVRTYYMLHVSAI